MPIDANSEYLALTLSNASLDNAPIILFEYL